MEDRGCETYSRGEWKELKIERLSNRYLPNMKQINTSFQWELWPDCNFCISFIKAARGDERAFYDVYSLSLNGNKPFLDQTENLILLPDIAPLSEDHLLLISKHHFPSFAAMPKTVLSESGNIFKKTVGRMAQFHPETEIFVFEHGVGTIEGQTVYCGSCQRTDHAHMHIIPLPKTRANGIAEILARKVIQEFHLKLKLTPPITSLALMKETGGNPYILFWSSLDLDKTYVLIQDSMDIVIPSQITRKLLAYQSLGLNDGNADRWDWRNLVDLYPQEMENMVRSTIRRWAV